MSKLVITTFFALAATWSVAAEEEVRYLTFDNQPLGSVAAPLVMRTYLPDLDLGRAVLSNHGEGRNTPRYSAKTGVLSSSSEDQPIPGIPAGIAVNYGKVLSYVWDTTECRLLYAWTNGFLDMTSYWGSPEGGSRKKNDYVPRLIGTLFYKARGSHPLQINGEKVTEITYQSHKRVEGSPVFSFRANGVEVEVEIKAGASPQTLHLCYRSTDESASLDFDAENTAYEILLSEQSELTVLVRPNASGVYTGYKEEVITIKTANAEAGEKLYTNFGCSACHTVDGSRNHGPSFQGLGGSMRELVDGSKIAADFAYLKESIKNPNAKHVTGYPAGMMPAYPLDDKQIESLVLYIQSLK